MLSQIDSAVVDEQMDLTLLDAIWQHIHQHLEAKKQRIVQEIRQYPPPIPACDVQFNGLLEERAALLQELGQVKGILKQSLTVKDHIELLNAFVLSSQYLNGELKEKIRQALQATE